MASQAPHEKVQVNLNEAHSSFPVPYEEFDDIYGHDHEQQEHFVTPEQIKEHLLGLSPQDVLKMPMEVALRHFRHFSRETREKLKAYYRYYASLPADDEEFVPHNRRPSSPPRTASNSGTPDQEREGEQIAADHFKGPIDPHMQDRDELFLFQDRPPSPSANQERRDAETALALSIAWHKLYTVQGFS